MAYCAALLLRHGHLVFAGPRDGTRCCRVARVRSAGGCGCPPPRSPVCPTSRARADALPFLERASGLKCPSDRDFADFIVDYLADPSVRIVRRVVGGAPDAPAGDPGSACVWRVTAGHARTRQAGQRGVVW